MEFLELSIETLSNIDDLLDRWDCDNILNIKCLILSGDQDYKLISGHVVYIEGWFSIKVPHMKDGQIIN
jgi:hypothetical protein